MIYQHERVRPKEVTYNTFFPLRSPHPEDALLVATVLDRPGIVAVPGHGERVVSIHLGRSVPAGGDSGADFETGARVLASPSA